MPGPITTFSSGQLRFPPPIPTLSNTNPILHLSPHNRRPLPDPAHARTMTEQMWGSEPLDVQSENVDSVKPVNDPLGSRWEVNTKKLDSVAGVDGRLVRLWSRIVYQGLDPDDVSYFVTGCQEVSGVSYLDIFAYPKGGSIPVINSVIWPPFTLIVPSSIVDPSTRLGSWSPNHESDESHNEQRLVGGFPAIGVVQDLLRNIYSTVAACIGV